MINIRVEGDNFDPIFALLHRVQFPDLTPLVETVREIMLEDNGAGIMARTDSFGDRMDDLKPSTLRRRSGQGPQLAPEGESSPIITGYQVDDEEVGFNHVRLTGTWPGLPWVHFHVTGFTVQSKHGPVAVVARDPTGVRPDGIEKIRVATEAFCTSLIEV